MNKYNIKIEELNPLPKSSFRVYIEGDTNTEHRVVLDEEYYKKLMGDNNLSLEELIEKSFKFLLERESNTSILKGFNLRDIRNYFPEFEEVIAGNK